MRVEVMHKENARRSVIKDKMDYYVGIGIGPNFSSAELGSELEHVQDYLTDGFDFQEFSEAMKMVAEEKITYIKQQLESRLKFGLDPANASSRSNLLSFNVVSFL